MKKTLDKERKVQTEDKLFNFRPLFFVGVALCIGVVFSYVVTVYGISPLWALLPVSLAGMPFLFCTSWQHAKSVFIAFSVLFAFFLVGVFTFRAQIDDYRTNAVETGESYVSGCVIEYAATAYDAHVVIDELTIDGKSTKGKLIAYMPDSYTENISIADELFLFGCLQSDGAIFNEYGFKASQIHENIRFIMNVESCQKIGRSQSVFLNVRSRMQNVLQKGMDETPAAVALALLTGDTSRIDYSLLENVRYGGIAHIFAVSGLHIGALFAFCMWLTGKTFLSKTSKILRFVLTAAVLLFYGGVCGYTSSVMRASVMCLVFYAARLIGVKMDMLECIGLSATIVLLFSPVALFTVGFQLSFAACLGIAFFAKLLNMGMLRLLVGKTPTRRLLENGDAAPPTVWESTRNSIVSFVAVTLSAQIATSPISLYHFGYLSVWSVFLNCLFVPIVSGVFAILLALVFIGCILPITASAVLLKVPSVVFSALLLVFEVVDFSSFAITGLQLGLGSFFGYYGVCIFLSDKWNVNKPLQYTLAGVCALVFALTL